MVRTLESTHGGENHREPGNNFVSQEDQEYHDYLTYLLTMVPLVNSTGQSAARRSVEFKGYVGIELLLPPPFFNTTIEKVQVPEKK